MVHPASPFRKRKAVAAVEFALLLPFLLLLIVGVWDVGRLVQVYQLLYNASREGARLAAQGLIINKQGAHTEIHVNTGSPNVKDTIRNYLREGGLNTNNLQVTFTYLDGDTTKTEPYQAAKGQRFRITTTLPTSNVRWSLLTLVNRSEMTAVVEWKSLVDDPFTLDTTIPQW